MANNITGIVNQTKINAQLKFSVKREAATEEITITENGTYRAGAEIDGYNVVNVNVPNPSTGTIEITENGTYDVMEKAQAVVNVPVGVPEDYKKTLEQRNNIIDEIKLAGIEKLREHGISNIRNCKKITLPDTTEQGASNFASCVELEEAYLPKLTNVDNGYNFQNCNSLKKVDFGAIASLGGNNYRFNAVAKLETIIIRTSTVCAMTFKLPNAAKFVNGTGFFYVPSRLVNEYKNATNWADYSNQIRAIEDYPDITGG